MIRMEYQIALVISITSVLHKWWPGIRTFVKWKKKRKLISMNTSPLQNFALWHLVLEIPTKSMRSEAKKNHYRKHKNRTNAFESKQKPWPIPHRKQTKEWYSFVWRAVSAGVTVNCTFGLVRLIITTIIMIYSRFNGNIYKCECSVHLWKWP